MRLLEDEEVEITELYYTDDVVLTAKDEKILNRNLGIYKKALKINMNKNIGKTWYKGTVYRPKGRKHF